MMQVNDKHAAYALALSKRPSGQNPLLDHGALASATQAQPALLPHLQAIASNPGLAQLATSGQGVQTLPSGGGGQGGASSTATSATDPSGVSNPNRAVGYGGSSNRRRAVDIRHQILGFKTVALASGGVNQNVSATPQVAIKGNRLVIAPTVVTAAGTIQQILVGTKNQMAGNTAEPFDVYSPESYAGEVDFDICTSAIQLSALVSSTAACQWYAALVGQVRGKPIRPKHTKVVGFGLGATSIAAGSTVVITVNPQLDFVTRKIALTPGATFSDSLVIQSIFCGNALQLASQDPIPASVFDDKYDLYLDFDMISAAVALQFTVTNIGTASATFQGTARGDCDPAQMSGGTLQYS